MKGLPPQINFVMKNLNFASINPYNRTVYTKIYQCSAVILSLYVIFWHFWEFIFNFNGVETIGRAKLTPCLITKFVQYLIFAFNYKAIRKPLDLMHDFWHWDKFGTALGDKLQATSDKWYFFIKFYFGVILSNVVILICEPYFMPGYELIYYQYDYCDVANSSLCYHINFLLQLVMLLFVQIPVLFAFDLMFLAFVAQIYIQLELIKAAFGEYKSHADGRAFLKEIVDQHNVIIEFIQAFDSWSSSLQLAKYINITGQMICCLYMLTLKGFPPDLSHIYNYGLPFLTVMIMLYMYSWGGAVIYDQSLSVADAAYEMNWDDVGDMNLTKDLSFIVMRSQTPEILTAGYFKLNMEAFVKAVQNAISVYGLLMTLATDEQVTVILAKDITRKITS